MFDMRHGHLYNASPTTTTHIGYAKLTTRKRRTQGARRNIVVTMNARTGAQQEQEQCDHHNVFNIDKFHYTYIRTGEGQGQGWQQGQGEEQGVQEGGEAPGQGPAQERRIVVRISRPRRL